MNRMMKRYSLIKEWDDTKKYFEEHQEKVVEPMKLNIKILNELYENEINKINTIYEKNLDIENEDSFNLAIKYLQQGLNPLVLNMASDYIPGGGVAKGSISQEEELFRRSNAHMTHLKKWYPLGMEEMIYSPEITIIKDSSDLNYKKIEEKKVGMIAIAAIRNPKLVNNKYDKKDYDIMYQKIESIFKLGILMYHDTLVLGAFGCGAFNNPPTEVSNIFEEMISKYGKYFKKIGFAILVVKNKDNENLVTFKNIIQK